MYRRLVFLATALTFVLVVVGAYVRLSDAGLGCPDWPGCYGAPTPHHAASEITQAQQIQPSGPVSMAKAWKEMAHRYVAGTLGLLVLAICICAWRGRAPRQGPWLPTALVAVVALQAALGMWTVTLLLKPAIVTAHLAGGMATLAILTWLSMRQTAGGARPAGHGLRIAALLGAALLAAQILLGGWVSSNYAATACADLPTCQGLWLPQMDFRNAFHVLRELGQSADGELLPLAALTAIHWMHRLGAVALLACLAIFGYALARRPGHGAWGAALIAAACAQFLLGLANVWLSLPLPLAAAHNAGAALLVVLMTAINFRLRAAAAFSSSPDATRLIHEGAAA